MKSVTIIKNIRFGIIFVAIIFPHALVSSKVEAVPVVGFGAGNAVTSADRTAGFGAIGTNWIDLSVFSEGLLSISVGDTSLVGFDPFNGLGDGTGVGFYYGNGGNNSFVTISATDGAGFTGLEFLLGHGPLNSTTNVVWETLSNGITTGSGAFQTQKGIVGWADVLGFDTLRVGANSLAYTAFGELQAIALDDLSVELQTPISVVPLPASLPLFASGLGILGFMGWRKRRRNGAA